MDKSYNRHAYACLPVTTANVSGWELILQKDITVSYDGGDRPPVLLTDGTIVEESLEEAPHVVDIAKATIPGVVSFPTSWIFNLPEHYALWVTGSPNYFIDGAVPMSASIPSWWPDDFNMNWKITKINEPVTFRAGEPFMFFQIYDTRIMPSVDFEVCIDSAQSKSTETDNDCQFDRVEYRKFKEQQRTDAPWKWMGTMRTGLDHKGQRIGPRYGRIEQLKEPQWPKKM